MKQFTDYITDFIFVQDKPEKADYIMIPGSGYGELSLEAARLYHLGYAEQIIVSGRYSKLIPAFEGPVSPAEYAGKKYETEADFHSHVMMDQGVPEEAIIKEEEATFTYENALYIRKMLQSHYGFDPDKKYKVLLVTQAFHARRSLMYFQYVFPNVTFLCQPAMTQGINRENWMDTEKGRKTVLGEVSRIGTQFTDIIEKTDVVWKEILG